MPAPYPFLDSVWLAQPITIGNRYGMNSVAFRNFSEPPTIPEFRRKRRVIEHGMSPAGIGLPGNRVVEAYKTNPNHYDLDFTAELVTPAQVALVRGYVESVDPTDPGYVTVNLGEATTYLGVMAEDYPTVENYRYNGRVCHRLGVRVLVLGVFAGSISPPP